jgi:hypothetical protein
VLSYFSISSLEEEFGVHSILVDKRGKTFVRYTATAVFASGSYKKLFKVKEHKSNKTYVWGEVKGKRSLDKFNAPVMQKFRQFLKTHPHLAFNSVHTFIDYENAEQKTSVGVIEHENLAPKDDEDDEPYLSYKQLLWEAMSPDPRQRPNAETFEAKLRQLNEAGKLPI